MYRMVAIDNPYKGDSGSMSMALWPNEKGEIQYEHNARPRVGAAMRVGSFRAGTMSTQDWWQTTIITDIIEDTPNRVLFRTKNTTYEWKYED